MNIDAKPQAQEPATYTTQDGREWVKCTPQEWDNFGDRSREILLIEGRLVFVRRA